jgi:hypothetical protein
MDDLSGSEGSALPVVRRSHGDTMESGAVGLEVQRGDELGGPRAGFTCGFLGLVAPRHLPAEPVDCDGGIQTPCARTDARGTPSSSRSGVSPQWYPFIAGRRQEERTKLSLGHPSNGNADTNRTTRNAAVTASNTTHGLVLRYSGERRGARRRWQGCFGGHSLHYPLTLQYDATTGHPNVAASASVGILATAGSHVSGKLKPDRSKLSR